MIKTINTAHSEAVIYRTENLERYLKEIGKYEKVPNAEERALLIEAKKGDQAARDRLTLAHLRFVVSCAKEYQRYKIELSDLISAGNEGLIEAINKFDLNQEVKFISYAVWRIKAKMIEFIRQNVALIALPLNQQDQLTKLTRLKGKIENKLQVMEIGFEQALEIAAEDESENLDYSFSYIKDALFTSNEFTSMDSTIPGNKDFCLAQTIPSGDNSVEREMYNDERKRIINNVLNELPELQMQVLRLSFGFEDGIMHTNDYIAQSLKKNPENIRQIKKKGMKTLFGYKYLQTLINI